jgi:mRNA interferase RelE/StbE
LTWAVEFDDRARKELRKLDEAAQKQILRYLRSRIATESDPRRFGKALSTDKVGLWRYRVGDYRLVCRIEDGKVVVLVLRAGHRKNVYDF